MATKIFVNLPVKDLQRAAKTPELGQQLIGAAEHVPVVLRELAQTKQAL